MGMLVVKNAVLILLMILIIHFMIRNKLTDEHNTFRRKLIYMDTMRSVGSDRENLIRAVSDAGAGVIGKSTLSSMYNNNDNNGIEGGWAEEQSVDKDFVVPSNAIDEEDNGQDMVNVIINKDLAEESKKEPIAKPDMVRRVLVAPTAAGCEGGEREAHMRELYDFVYSDEDKPRGSAGSDINKYFPETVKDHTVVDANEISLHSKHIADKLLARDTESPTCNFEVIGSLCSDKNGVPNVRGGIDGIEGIEQSTASFYSEL